MEQPSASGIIAQWPEESREAAQLVIDSYGDPDETSPSLLTWYNAGPWKRVLAAREFLDHEFPVPHIDSVESVIDYSVPPEKFGPLAQFDGSVIVERTAGEVSTRCHDEQANFLALNLMNDIVAGAKTVEEARDYYAHEFLQYRRKEPTPYMEGLRFRTGGDTAHRDERMLSDQELEQAAKDGRRKEKSSP